MWPSTGKPGTMRHPSKKFFLTLQSCRSPDIELSKFYRRNLSRSHYNRPNNSLPSAWNNKFLRNRSIFSRYLRTPRCPRYSCRRSHMIHLQLLFFVCLFVFCCCFCCCFCCFYIHKHNFLSSSAAFGGLASIIREKMSKRITDGGPYW